MRKIVILDGFTANPGDLSFQALEKWGEVVVWDRTSPEELLQRGAGAEILITNKTVLNAEMISQLPDLKMISVLATGWNVVDTDAARQRGIVVSNVPAYSTESVVQHTFAHILNLASALSVHAGAVLKGAWQHSLDFSFCHRPLMELAGKTLGIIGFGTIGRRVACVAHAFQMKTIAYGPHLDIGTIYPSEFGGTNAVSLEDLFAQSDIVSLHCPLTGTNRGLVSRENLALMKPTAYLINTARGPLIDETALADFLNQGKIAGAALDVLCQEPPTQTNPLIGAKNCWITPHNAWATREARQRLIDVTVENIRHFCLGSPIHVVNF